MAGSTQANPQLNSIVSVGQQKVAQARKSQARINKLQDDTSSLISEFKTVNNAIEGLRIYNSQLERQIQSQKDIMQKLDGSIGQITVIQRQVQPLVLEQLEVLRQHVALDWPYRKDLRASRVEKLAGIMEDADVTIAEKFRQMLEIYSIEAEYSKKIDSYSDSVNFGGQDLVMDIVAIGRIALMAQTPDQSVTLAWDRGVGKWTEMGSEYKKPVRNAIKIAQKTAQNDIMLLPVEAPEAAK